MNTLNQIHDKLRKFANDHLQIQGFGFGDRWEVGDNIAQQLMWVVPGDTIVKNNRLQRHFIVFFEDLVNKSQNNQTDVLSDMEQVGLDFISFLKQSKDINFKLENEPKLTPYTEKTDNETTGWYCDVDISCGFNYDECAIPFGEKVSDSYMCFDGINQYAIKEDFKKNIYQRLLLSFNNIVPTETPFPYNVGDILTLWAIEGDVINTIGTVKIKEIQENVFICELMTGYYAAATTIGTDIDNDYWSVQGETTIVGDPSWQLHITFKAKELNGIQTIWSVQGQGETDGYKITYLYLNNNKLWFQSLDLGITIEQDLLYTFIINFSRSENNWILQVNDKDGNFGYESPYVDSFYDFRYYLQLSEKYDTYFGADKDGDFANICIGLVRLYVGGELQALYRGSTNDTVGDNDLTFVNF